MAEETIARACMVLLVLVPMPAHMNDPVLVLVYMNVAVLVLAYMNAPVLEQIDSFLAPPREVGYSRPCRSLRPRASHRASDRGSALHQFIADINHP